MQKFWRIAVRRNLLPFHSGMQTTQSKFSPAITDHGRPSQETK
jgi:hypothetical protein